MDEYVAIFAGILLASVTIPFFLFLSRNAILAKKKQATPNGVSSAIFSLFASIYAFFIGFCIVTLWNNFNHMKTTAQGEANAILMADYLSRSFPDSDEFRRVLFTYAQRVIRNEWNAMNGVSAMDQETQQTFNRLWELFRKLKPDNREDNVLYVELGSSLVDASRHRSSRSLALDGNLYPPVWVIIIVGFIGICVELYANSGSFGRVRFFMEAVVIFVVISCIYFIFDLSTPFSGFIKIPNDAFVFACDRMLEGIRAMPHSGVH